MEEEIRQARDRLGFWEGARDKALDFLDYAKAQCKETEQGISSANSALIELLEEASKGK